MTTATEHPTVHEAWSRVMAAVQAVGKDGRNTQQNYNFRGIDAVVNAVGPELRSEGVIVVPIGVEYADERFTTKNGANMRGVTATVTFRVYGPRGDYFDGQALGESADSGDKAVPKAHSVAYRTFLLQSLCIPTDEPDPDSESYERGAGETADAGSHSRKQLDTEVLSESTRASVVKFAEDAGFKFYEVASELYPDVAHDNLTVAQAKAVCAEISTRKKAAA